MSEIFISYRRTDSGAVAGRLCADLQHAYGEAAVFMDTSSIAPGAVWPKRLEEALALAKVVLVVMGPQWIRAANEWGERLIDQEDDWVRREVGSALAADKQVFPLLVGGARMPPAERLPPSIRGLSDRQAVPLRDEFFEHDLKLVVSQVEAGAELGGRPAVDNWYPQPPPDVPDPLGEEKLAVALRTVLRSWQVVESALPQDPSRTRVELYREYRFKTFRDAIAFMNEVAPGCDIAIHHPRWENVWRHVRVFLTTWDIGHRISDRDVQLAKYFDSAFEDFAGADPPA
ncbi:4a-hydroxytetrahydrobiopterin dehydratase [[Actinomadura] parvosata]|uniref:4a-hydroxytetrahydrobiopterin dehydratase n=1 Tax=[Actinomadura] parvosata TaxID=1955412 RepID=UPI00406CBDC8